MPVYSKILFIAVLLSTIIGYSTDNVSITLSAIPYILLILYAFFSPDFYKRRFIIPVVLFTVILCLISLSLHGILAAKDLFISLGGLLCAQYYVSKHRFNPQIIFMVYLLILIPQFFYDSIVYGGDDLKYIPVGENWYLNVITSDSTKHDTCVLGFLLLSASAFYGIMKRKMNLYHWGFIILGLYFIIFSGSRGGLMALLSAVFVYYLNKSKVRKGVTILSIILIIAFVYGIEIFMDSFISIGRKDSIIAEFLKVESFQNHGVSAGRMWLWVYHLQEFITSHYLGGGREVIDFTVGDFVKGEVAEAGSESPFTALLACYGIIGILLIMVYFGMFVYALNRKNRFAVFITTIALIQTIATGINYFSFMTYNSVLFFNLYFASLEEHSKKECIS
jgi:hypothetical protein